MAAVGRRVCKLSSIPGFGASKSKVSSSSWSFHRSIFDPFPVSGARHFSQWVKFNGKHLFLVDTLALVRTLEGEGVPSKQADAIIAATTEVLKDSLENVSQSFVSKGEMRKIEMILESNLSKFKAEMQSSQGLVPVVNMLGLIEGFVCCLYSLQTSGILFYCHKYDFHELQ